MKHPRQWLSCFAVAVAGVVVWASSGPRPDSIWLIALDAAGRETASIVRQQPEIAFYDSGDQPVAPADSGYVVVVEGGGTVTKLKPGDASVWEHRYRLPGCKVIRRVPAGYILAGYDDDRGYFGAGPRVPFFTLWVAGISDRGDSLWTLRWDGPVIGELHVVPRSEGGGVAIVLTSIDRASRTPQLVLLLITADGQLEREATLLEGGPPSGCTGLANLPDGGFLLTGQKRTPLSPQDTPWLMAADAEGRVFWHRELEVFAGGSVELLANVAGGHYLLCGYGPRTEGSSVLRWTAAKVHPTGDTLWTRRYGPDEYHSQPESRAFIYAHYETSDHRHLLAGVQTVSRSGWLLTLSHMGDSLESRTFPDRRRVSADFRGHLNAILPGDSGGVILAGAAWEHRPESQ